MRRRLTILLIAWFSLFSVAVPAITCAAAAQHPDCCPDGRTPPCAECPKHAPGLGASPAHCLASPVSTANAGVVHEQVRKAVQPDLVPAIITPPARALITASTEPIRQRWRPPHDNLETPAYLVTGRLRL